MQPREFCIERRRVIPPTVYVVREQLPPIDQIQTDPGMRLAFIKYSAYDAQVILLYSLLVIVLSNIKMLNFIFLKNNDTRLISTH